MSALFGHWLPHREGCCLVLMVPLLVNGINGRLVGRRLSLNGCYRYTATLLISHGETHALPVSTTSYHYCYHMRTRAFVVVTRLPENNVYLSTRVYADYTTTIAYACSEYTLNGALCCRRMTLFVTADGMASEMMIGCDGCWWR